MAKNGTSAGTISQPAAGEDPAAGVLTDEAILAELGIGGTESDDDGTEESELEDAAESELETEDDDGADDGDGASDGEDDEEAAGGDISSARCHAGC
jgi:hypothetical protein